MKQRRKDLPVVRRALTNHALARIVGGSTAAPEAALPATGPAPLATWPTGDTAGTPAQPADPEPIFRLDPP